MRSCLKWQNQNQFASFRQYIDRSTNCTENLKILQYIVTGIYIKINAIEHEMIVFGRKRGFIEFLN